MMNVYCALSLSQPLTRPADSSMCSKTEKKMMEWNESPLWESSRKCFDHDRTLHRLHRPSRANDLQYQCIAVCLCTWTNPPSIVTYLSTVYTVRSVLRLDVFSVRPQPREHPAFRPRSCVPATRITTLRTHHQLSCYINCHPRRFAHSNNCHPTAST